MDKKNEWNKINKLRNGSKITSTIQSILHLFINAFYILINFHNFHKYLLIVYHNRK